MMIDHLSKKELIYKSIEELEILIKNLQREYRDKIEKERIAQREGRSNIYHGRQVINEIWKAKTVLDFKIKERERET